MSITDFNTDKLYGKHLTKFFLSWILMMISGYVTAQDLGQIGKAKLFRLTGGVSANSVFYEGKSNREPFTYFLNGNVNLNISNVYNIPFSFSYSNQKFNSSNPFSFNRLSIHPSYKWATVHIGDVNMTFSPYTLNGHQFTGVGFDLTPAGKWKLSAMYGRLLKQSEYDAEASESTPAYKRMGYGFKAGYDNEKTRIALILFKAKDEENSIKNPVPAELELQAKENVVLSIEGGIKVFEKGEIQIEGATSSITENLNATEEGEQGGLFALLMDTNVTTSTYKAYNVSFNYPVGSGSLGVGYEYIDPEYRTLGAYFFNNDLENFTVNAYQNIFDNKVNITVNGGIQRDDLKNTKSSQLQRVVTAVNVNYNASEKLTISTAYSNFQSYTNIKNQFDYINEVSQFDHLDTLNFQQISQNTNININYLLKNTETNNQNISFNGSLNNAVNKQGGNVVENGTSNFYNGNVAYSLGYPASQFTVSGSVNVSYSKVGGATSTTYGPILSANKSFFDKSLRTSGSLSYNQSHVDSKKQSEVANLRLGGNYSLKKKHNFNLNLLTQYRKNNASSQVEFTAILGYNYILDKIKVPKIKFPGAKPKEKKKAPKEKKGQWISFKYRDSLYEGTLPQINDQLYSLQRHSRFDFIPAYKKEELKMLRLIAAQERNTRIYRPKALDFLKALYSYEDFLAQYHELIFNTLLELKVDMYRLDEAFEGEFVKAKIEVDNHELFKLSEQERKNKPEELQKKFKDLKFDEKVALDKLIAHRWMLEYIEKYKVIEDLQKPDKFLTEVMEEEKDNIFRMWDRDDPKPKVQLYIITKIIAHYNMKSKTYTDKDKVELKYINRR
ncbi:TonB-dependent receptor [Flavivirga algicola]|uniref:Outer membrane protein beta-barrel domain-containing protein n=1 Tax=Flavivirga algicola TaxID=2729136 RepID=A0ABX1RTA8_9FLAO|nr:hypothetical protein [Flavivirga algicola]NMH85953.1 hypothetical protein [Flavivirga algicola]